MNKMNYLKFNVFALAAFAVMLSACKKDRAENVYEKEVVTKGIYILNEGTMGNNNSSITYYDVDKKTVVADYYAQVNGSKLGETANDLQVYGDKMYCVVTGIAGKAQSFVDVMDVNTGKSIKRIPFNTTNDGFLPRFITFYKNKAYVSRYDGVISRIDTASLTIDADLQLKNGNDNAAGLEGLAVANGKLYVAGSDYYLSSHSLKDKVVVIDLTTFAKTKDIIINYNPQQIAVAATGEVFVNSWGNYFDILPALQKINTTTDVVAQTEGADLGTIKIVGDQAWATQDVYSDKPKVTAINIATGKLGANLITDGTAIGTPYGISINPLDQSVVIADSGTSKAFVFGKDGKVKYSFATGSFPKAAAFTYRTRFVSEN